MTDRDYEAEQAVFEKRLKQALYEQDFEWLDEHARCGCCCDEHTSSGCPARLVGNCRGQDSLTYADIEGWRKHYGMTEEEFYG
jgi:hypothetical protein